MYSYKSPPRKHSQNFLANRQLVKQLVRRTNIGHNDTVVEIGPGTGVITAEVVSKAKQVIAVELDKNLALKLRNKLPHNSQLKIRQQDFLQFQLPIRPYKIIGNIPFGLTALIMRKILDKTRSPTDAYLIMQKEAAWKYTGTPSGQNYLCSIIQQPYFSFKYLQTISRNQFKPRPRVDAAFVHIHQRENPLLPTRQNQHFTQFVTQGFTGTKNTLAKNLRDFFSYRQWQKQAKLLKIRPKATPGELTIKQWVGLFFLGRGARKQQK